MISTLCSEVSLNIGIPACGVVSATVKAALVIPGVVASSENVGARAFGDRTLLSLGSMTFGTNLLRQGGTVSGIRGYLCTERSGRNRGREKHYKIGRKLHLNISQLVQKRFDWLESASDDGGGIVDRQTSTR